MLISLSVVVLILAVVFTIMAISGKSTLPVAVLMLCLLELLRVVPFKG